MKVLVALDGSKHSDLVCDFVADLNSEKCEDADLILLYVQEPLLVGSYLSVLPSPILDEIKSDALAEAKNVLNTAKEKLSSCYKQSRIETIIADGSPKEEIIKMAANNNVELIVMGSHGRSNFQKLFLGSVSQAVCASAPCSVLIVRKPEK